MDKTGGRCEYMNEEKKIGSEFVFAVWMLIKQIAQMVSDSNTRMDSLAFHSNYLNVCQSL